MRESFQSIISEDWSMFYCSNKRWWISSWVKSYEEILKIVRLNFLAYIILEIDQGIIGWIWKFLTFFTNILIQLKMKIWEEISNNSLLLWHFGTFPRLFPWLLSLLWSYYNHPSGDNNDHALISRLKITLESFFLRFISAANSFKISFVFDAILCRRRSLSSLNSIKKFIQLNEISNRLKYNLARSSIVSAGVPITRALSDRLLAEIIQQQHSSLFFKLEIYLVFRSIVHVSSMSQPVHENQYKLKR